MANIKYSDLLDDVLPHLAADPSDPVTEYAIKRAVVEFCERSWVWKYLPDPMDVMAGESYYDLDIPPGSDVVKVMKVLLQGDPLVPRSIDYLDSDVLGWRTSRENPLYFAQVDTEQVILAPVPDTSVTGGLVMTLALKPAIKSTDFPGWIYNQYLYALADGALSKLLLMTGRPWTDVAAGQDKRRSFEEAIANARESATTGLGRDVIRTKPQY